MSIAAGLFKKVFDLDSKIYYQYKDLEYYTGGWPGENTSPRLESFVKKIAEMFEMYIYLGNLDRLNMYFNKFGIQISSTNDIDKKFGNDSAIILSTNKIRKFKQIAGCDNVPTSRKEFLNILVNVGLECQKVICECADEIKIENGKKIENECEIKPSNFCQAVSIKASEKIKTRKST